MAGEITILFACFCFFAFTLSPFTVVGCNVFILAGQSNMAGRGGVVGVNKTFSRWDGQIPLECEANPHILRLNDELLWEEAQEPLHDGISLSNCSINYRANGLGSGMPFSNSILKRDPTFGVIGLVPCAVGGTGIIEWSRGSCLYNRLLRRARAAALEGGVLRGMLWYQGETDTDTRQSADMYQTRLKTFFTDLRTDLLSPWLPIIQVALASGGNVTSIREIVRKAQLNTSLGNVALASGSDPTNVEIVRKAQLNTSLTNVKCVDAAGLPLNGDKLHLNTLAQVQLGSMLADAFLRYF